MSAGLHAILDLRRGEAAQVARAGGALAALIAGHTVLETARDALFLRELPMNRLAMVYAAMAVLALAAVPAGAWLVRRCGRRGALVASLGGASIGTATFALVPIGPVTVMALYLWTGLVATVVVVQFWLVIGGMFTASQGRRLTPAIATAGALGAFLGAAAASLLVREVEVRHLVPLAAGLFAIAARIVRGMPAAASVAEPPQRAGSRMIGRSGYVRRLALVIGLSTAALLAADYLFKVTVGRSVPSAELPALLAHYNAAVTALSLLVQVVGVGWVVRRWGVHVALVVLPLLLVGGALLSVALPAGLAGVLLAKGADGVLRHSLHRVSLELLWIPLPDDVRGRVREPIDGVIVRAAQAVAAGGLFAIAPAGAAAPAVLAGVVAALACLWLLAVASMRRAYLDHVPISGRNSP